MSRLIIVSNRLPVRVKVKGRELKIEPSVGGLATALSAFYKRCDGIWIGWPGVAYEMVRNVKDDVEIELKKMGCYPVLLSQRQIERYYHGFCNKTIWPLFHYFLQFTVYDKRFYDEYRRVNEKFCEIVAKIAKPDDIVWIHDYHLMLLPKLIRECIPDATIGFFLHIPFPSFEIFRTLPWRKEILEGILGADLVGFHTYDYVRHFLDCVRRILGYEHTLGQITTEDRIVKVDAFPMGIDYDRFANALGDSKVKSEIDRIRRKSKGCKIILSIDRLDYTKGIPQRLKAFDLFLERYPEFREKVILILIAVPSRMGVEHYRTLKREVDELVGRINGKYGTINWIPIWYIYRFVPFETLVALYGVADVAMVTPLRDGMNLVSKEFIATNDEGVLILSEMAGASKELIEAVIVNPNDIEDVAESIRMALTMSKDDRIERNRAMKERIRRYNVFRWAGDFLEKIGHVKDVQKEFDVKKLSEDIERKIVDDYLRSDNRLLLLDYDGTLIPFAERPEKAKPDEELLEVLRGLSSDSKNEVVIVSGRDRDTLDSWFGNLNVGLVAEHGVWIKEAGKNWRIIEPLNADWKDEIRPILEQYVDRTPGSFVEEKDFSIVWHYRKVDPDLASARAKELKDILLHLTANLNLEVLEGDKVIEVKSVGINKGRAVMEFVSKRRWGFILAVGDDWTDEDMFAVMPKGSYSIKVGFAPSKAKFYVGSYLEVRNLLAEFLRSSYP